MINDFLLFTKRFDCTLIDRVETFGTQLSATADAERCDKMTYFLTRLQPVPMCYYNLLLIEDPSLAAARNQSSANPLAFSAIPKLA